MIEYYNELNIDKVDLYKQKKAVGRGLAGVGAGAMFIPGVGRIAGLAIAGVETGVRAANEAYFDTVDAYKTNDKELLVKGYQAKQIALQHIQTIAAGEYNLDRSFREDIARAIGTSTGKDSLRFADNAEATMNDGLYARLLLDELERTQDKELFDAFIGGVSETDKDFYTENKHVRSEKIESIKEKVEIRQAYIEQRVGVTTKKTTTKTIDVITGRKKEETTKTHVLDRVGAMTNEGVDMQTFLQRVLHESHVAE